ncbi:ribonuclease H-like domain-containing protein [Tanacetum coccineum]
MAIITNNKVSLCSKTCIDSYYKLKTLCDEQTNQFSEQEAKILAYDQVVKKLKAQVVIFQKKQLSLNEQLTFQANELYEKDEKLKKYRRIGMKAVKEKEQLQKIVDSWKNSSKNLWKLVDSGMSSTSKVGLGYEIKSNDEVLSYEEEMNHTVFNCTEEDFVDKPLYSRFSKTDNFKGVPHPLTGDYTPQPQQEIDDSLYVYGKKGPQKPETSVSDDKFSENSVTSNEEVVSAPKPKEAEPSCVTHVKTPKQPMKNQGTPKVNGKNWNEMMERKLGEGYSFIKKKCFVCGSLSHLIRDCDFYEKKMAREAELKKQRVFNTGNGVAKPVWNNANRVNHANHFVPRPVQLIAVRQNVNSVRPNVNTGRANVNSVRQNVNSVRSNVNTGSFNINTVKAKQPINTSNSNSFSPVRPQVNKFNQRSNFSKSHSPVRRPIVRNTAKMSYTHAVKGNWGTAVKTSAGYNWRKTRPNSNCNSGSNFIRTDHPLKNMEDRGIFDSGCSGHMTGNKDHLDDFEECKGGSVTFGGSKGYITGKGRIRVGNLDFDSVSFVKELGHFNLFSISQICDKQHKVLFTETECLVVSPDFKMPDENQILLKVPRQHNMYSFDMKTPALTKDYACLIAKATSDESKLWHRSNGTEFKNRDMLEFCGNKGIKQEYSNARTPQQNGVAERMNRTLIEAARTMLADSLLPTTFWAEAVSTACYIFNRKNYVKRVGTSEVTNSACTLQTPNANASEEEDEAEELIVVPTTVRHTAAKVRPRKSSTNSKAEEFLTELQNLKTQEKEAYSTGISEDTPEILAFRRELDELALKHLREVPKNKATSTTSVNSGSGPVIINMLVRLIRYCRHTSFNKPQKVGVLMGFFYDDEGMVYDFNNLPKNRVQQNSGAHALEEPKKISEALKDDSWVEAMQEELLQFRLQQVWILVDLPHGAKVIGTKWVYRNKRDERGVVVRNKARLVAQGHRQEEGID